MAISVGGYGAEETPMSDINTTPLVDVMLVLLIIFLITIPVVNQTVPLRLPKETNVPRQTRAENIEISVSRDGDVYWNMEAIADSDALARRLKEAAAMSPQPELQLRADKDTRYEVVAQVMAAAQSHGLTRIGFVTDPKEKK